MLKLPTPCVFFLCQTTLLKVSNMCINLSSPHFPEHSLLEWRVFLVITNVSPITRGWFLKHFLGVGAGEWTRTPFLSVSKSFYLAIEIWNKTNNKRENSTAKLKMRAEENSSLVSGSWSEFKLTNEMGQSANCSFLLLEYLLCLKRKSTGIYRMGTRNIATVPQTADQETWSTPDSIACYTQSVMIHKEGEKQHLWALKTLIICHHLSGSLINQGFRTETREPGCSWQPWTGPEAGVMRTKFTNFCCQVTDMIFTIRWKIRDFPCVLHHCQLTQNGSFSVQPIRCICVCFFFSVIRNSHNVLRELRDLADSSVV